MSIGERIRQRREEIGISQAQLADAIGCKTKTSISRIENNLEKLTIQRLERVANALYVNPAVLAGWEEEKKSFSKVEKEIINKFRCLSAKDKNYVAMIVDLYYRGTQNDY